MKTEPQPPAPLDWHPAYRDKTWLLDWLNGAGEFANRHVMLVAFMPPIRIRDLSMDPTTADGPRTHTLTRKKAFGQAPYVGRPFVYAWHVGVDELGRSIAGESRIVYLSS